MPTPITEFRVGCAKTINKGNYNSVRVEASLTVNVAEGDDYQVLRRSALQDLYALLEDTYRKMDKGTPQNE